MMNKSTLGWYKNTNIYQFLDIDTPVAPMNWMQRDKSGVF